jgi:DNA-binding MarR family transcriptional regulator
MARRVTSKGKETTLVLDGLRRLVKTLREGSRAAEQALGLSGAQLFVLQALSKDSSLSLTELAERTHTHQSSVSVVVAKLVARKFVRRTRAEDDARRLVLRLTPRGAQVLERAPDATQDRLIAALGQLPAKERRALGQSLAKVAELMALPESAPQMFFEDAR